MLWGMAGYMKHLSRHIAERENVAILYCVIRKAGVCRGMQDILRARCNRQFTANGKMVGVDVGIDDIAEAKPHRGSRVEIGSGLAQGINDCARSMSCAAEEIRARDHGFGVEVLAKDHETRAP
jgi:hypothetical protein